jgi:hypothetical protein
MQVIVSVSIYMDRFNTYFLTNFVLLNRGISGEVPILNVGKGKPYEAPKTKSEMKKERKKAREEMKAKPT